MLYQYVELALVIMVVILAPFTFAAGVWNWWRRP